MLVADDEDERLDDPRDFAADGLGSLRSSTHGVGKGHDFDLEACGPGGFSDTFDRCGHAVRIRASNGEDVLFVPETDDPGTMRTKSILLIVALLATMLAACDATDGGSRASVFPRPVPEGVPIDGSVEVSYDYPPGSELRYDLAITQDIEYEVSGDASFLTSTPDPLPEEGRVTSRASTEILYQVSETSTDQAATIAISAVFPEPETTAFADGEPLDPEIYDELTRALAAIQPIEFAVGVNDRNAVLTSGGLGGLDVLSGQVGALTNLSNNQISRPVGPVFPESRKLSPGDRWTIDSTREAPGGPVVVTTENEVIALTEIDSRPHLTIESVTQTDGFDLDFSEVFRSLFAGFAAGEDGVPVDEADLEAFAEVVFAIVVEPSTGTAEYLFDVERHLVVATDQQSNVRTRWLLQTPDAETGDPTGFELTLDINRRADFRYLGN